ncbi:type II toxin-antitoxin system HicA family toxin [Methanospirillum sp.]|uniref:type II toxin-antitoxin system HicA family toxin n=1 Tax=Methanospirillum sp. TaxID=45200 RepID=UPI00298309D7|nr:type II toxin-antitoxin system HicA family toxin [Methanospirillum sp.]
MPANKLVSGAEAIKILCKHFGFEISGRKGSHVRLSKITPEGKVGTVIPMHNELAVGTLRYALKLAGITLNEFEIYL